MLQAPYTGSAPYIGHSICSYKQLLYPLILVIATIIHIYASKSISRSRSFVHMGSDKIQVGKLGGSFTNGKNFLVFAGEKHKWQ